MYQMFPLLAISLIVYAVLTLTPQLKPYLYTPPEVSRDDYAAYLEERHPVLGWPGRDWLARMADERICVPRLMTAVGGFGEVRRVLMSS